MQTSPTQLTTILSDFLGSAPSLDDLVAYRLPDDLQERAQLLLDKNRQGELSSEERAEMEAFRQLDHLMILIKAKARLRLRSQQ
jgi:hypothetical protein